MSGGGRVLAKIISAIFVEKARQNHTKSDKGEDAAK
jgi:hypothetical protein